MAPSIDQAQIQQAVCDEAMPRLAAMARNDNLRSLRRFEHDEPPPYASSTESENEEPPSPQRLPMPEVEAILNRPISDDEVEQIARDWAKLIRPEYTYHTEVWHEEGRFDDHIPGPRPLMFQNGNGFRRGGIIARHYVKRHWERLGVWNPGWGFPGRKRRPEDDQGQWTWWWEPDRVPGDEDSVDSQRLELMRRAVRLRQNLQRGEHVPILPQSHLRQNATAAQAEAFLISRPWFVFELEIVVENTRRHRLPFADDWGYPISPRTQVENWWKERGDWREDFDESGYMCAWKWRHESPSPEPEDLTAVQYMQNSPLDAVAEMEFTPSEVDELEIMELPEYQQPKGAWVIEEMEDYSPHFPGQLADLGDRAIKREKERKEQRKRWQAEGLLSESPEPSPQEGLFWQSARDRNIRLLNSLSPTDLDGSQEVLGSLEEDTPEPQAENQPVPPALRRSARIAALKRPAESSPLLRRSARIAAIKRPAEPPLPQEAPSKRRKGTAAAKTAVTVAQSVSHRVKPDDTGSGHTRVSAKQKSKNQPKRQRGRAQKNAAAPSSRAAAAGKKSTTALSSAATRSATRPAASGKPKGRMPAKKNKQ